MQLFKARPKVDLIVVGSGAAGSLIAAKASAAGKEVLILEAGPLRRLDDLISSQIWARRLKWGGAEVEELGNFRVGHNFNSGFGTGGSALHQYAVWPRLHEVDFKRVDFGPGLNWPIDYQDIRADYDQIQQEVGLSGDASAEFWRPPGDPYPLPPLPVFAQGSVLAEGFHSLGLHTAPMPMAILSQAYKGRSPCLYDGWCDAGCPIGALANPLVTYLPSAFTAGTKITHDATVSRILHDETGRKVTGVSYFDADGSEQTVHADQVALCAFAVQNARLLLNSKSTRHPNGLGNNQNQVGRYLMTHPAKLICGLFEQETQPFFGTAGGQLISQDQYDNKHKAGAYGSYQWLIANAARPSDLTGIANTRPDIYGHKLRPFMERAAGHFGQMNLVCEDVALPENRIVLSDKKDRFGIPIARCLHSIGERTKRLLELGTKEGLAIFRAAGAEHPWTGPDFGMHILGGTVMGNDPKASVCDSYGRCHDTDNLYIAGTGVFASSGAVNPTFSLHALAVRTVRQMISASS